MSSASQQPNKYFDVVTYTGNGGTQSITGLDFQPDLVWIKSRTDAYDHHLVDSVRGATNALFSNTTAAETTYTNGLVSFDSNGFTLGGETGHNNEGSSYVAWCWKAGDTTVTNTDGTITSQVCANPAIGFSVVSYTGDGGNDVSVGHSLNATPQLLIIKDRSSSSDWDFTYTFGDGSYDFMKLNLTDAKEDITGRSAPASSVFYVSGANSNINGRNYIAYCWSEVPGVSKMGSYSGTGVDNFVYTGFRPAYVLAKATSTTGSWFVLDSSRDLEGPRHKVLVPNVANSENPDHPDVVFNSNGFTLRADNGGWSNFSGIDYVYLAIAEAPQGIINTQELEFQDDTNISAFQPGEKITGTSSGSGTVISTDGATMNVVYNVEDPFLPGEIISKDSQGSGTISDINTESNTLTISGVEEVFSPNTNNYLVGSVERGGAVAISDTVTNVSKVSSSSVDPHSLRFSSDRSTYLSRTPSSAGNRKTWTYSGWAKLADPGSTSHIFASGDETTSNRLFFSSSEPHGRLKLSNRVSGISSDMFATTELFLDPNAWYHIVVAFDSTEQVETERMRVYINGVRVTRFDAYNAPTLDQDYNINSSMVHTIGYNNQDNYYNGYQSSIYLIDGLALSADEFAYDNNGIWDPKEYVGEYGKNGFHLSFDPEAGVNYSGSVAGPFTVGSAEQIYDGNASNTSYAQYAADTEVEIFNGSISGTTLELYLNNTANSALRINGDLVDVDAFDSNWGWVTVIDSLPPTINTITIQQNGVSSSISAIRLDGTILVEHSNISTDDSGRDNHFHDENFAVGNTSQVWSDFFTCNQPQNTGFGLTNAFDGDQDTFCNESAGAAVYTFTAQVSGNYRIKMYTNGVRPIKVDGTTVVTVPTSGTLALYEIGQVNEGQTIVIDGNGQAGGSHIAAWVVDGKILVDANIQDTVTDTPVSNYATLDPRVNVNNFEIVNGNLTFNKNNSNYGSVVSTQSTPTTGKWYAEVHITSSVGYASIGLISGYNNVINDWPGANSGVSYYGFNGDTYSEGIGQSYGEAYGSGDIIGIAWDADTGTATFYKNGTSQGLIGGIPIKNYKFAGCEYEASTGATHKWNFGQTPWSYDPPEGYKGLSM